MRSAKQIRNVYSVLCLLKDIYGYYRKQYNRVDCYLKKTVTVSFAINHSFQDQATEKAIKYKFNPSLTALTAMSLMTLELETQLMSSEIVTIRTILSSLIIFSEGKSNINLSKRNLIINTKKNLFSIVLSLKFRMPAFRTYTNSILYYQQTLGVWTSQFWKSIHSFLISSLLLKKFIFSSTFEHAVTC